MKPTAPLLALAALLALPSVEAHAWGQLGHRASARVAEARLTPAAKAAVRELLGPGETLADASTWPDEHRRDIPESAPWHYVNVPITEPGYSARFCQAGGCVVSKLDDFRKTLADPDAPRADRLLALRFVAHLVQDLHQPVHVGDRGDRGGNNLQLRFNGEGTNLHRLWDSGLLEAESRDESALVAELTRSITPDLAATWTRDGTPEIWANESHAAAKDAYKADTSGRMLKPGNAIDRNYVMRSLPVAKRRLAQSAVRLADMLNGALK